MANVQLLANMKAKIEKMAADVQTVQKELATAVTGMQGLQSQLTENKLVKEELDHLEDDSKIFKLVGPVLIPQEQSEANSTVSTRIEFIMKELETAKAKVENAEKSQHEKRTTLLREQQKFQALVQQTAAQGPQ